MCYLVVGAMATLEKDLGNLNLSSILFICLKGGAIRVSTEPVVEYGF